MVTFRFKSPEMMLLAAKAALIEARVKDPAATLLVSWSGQGSDVVLCVGGLEALRADVYIRRLTGSANVLEWR